MPKYIHKYGGTTSLSINFRPPWSSFPDKLENVNVIIVDNLEAVLQIANAFLIFRDQIK